MGGKTQLLTEIVERLPEPMSADRQIASYVEVFVGGGAVFFYLKNNFEIDQAVLCDANPELMLTFKVVQQAVDDLIVMLSELAAQYLPLEDADRKKMFYDIRTTFNEQGHLQKLPETLTSAHIQRAAWMIFLNRTCFNGLFRLNSKGGFNVPFGRYRNPLICNAPNLRAASQALQGVELHCGDFEESEKYISEGTLVYLDPPYRPLNATSSFTSYSKSGFNDTDQQRLAHFYRQMDQRGAFLILSNSDPKNENTDDTFFDDLYQGFTIDRVPASRMINSVASKRGKINEILVTNR